MAETADTMIKTRATEKLVTASPKANSRAKMRAGKPAPAPARTIPPVAKSQQTPRIIIVAEPAERLPAPAVIRQIIPGAVRRKIAVIINRLRIGRRINGRLVAGRRVGGIRLRRRRLSGHGLLEHRSIVAYRLVMIQHRGRNSRRHTHALQINDVVRREVEHRRGIIDIGSDDILRHAGNRHLDNVAGGFGKPRVIGSRWRRRHRLIGGGDAARSA